MFSVHRSECVQMTDTDQNQTICTPSTIDHIKVNVSLTCQNNSCRNEIMFNAPNDLICSILVFCVPLGVISIHHRKWILRKWSNVSVEQPRGIERLRARFNRYHFSCVGYTHTTNHWPIKRQVNAENDIKYGGQWNGTRHRMNWRRRLAFGTQRKLTDQQSLRFNRSSSVRLYTYAFFEWHEPSPVRPVVNAWHRR